MFEVVCQCDRCGRKLEYTPMANEPVGGTIFYIPILNTENNVILKNAREVVLCTNCIDELNTSFLHL